MLNNNHKRESQEWLNRKVAETFAVQKFDLATLDNKIIKQYRTFIKNLATASNGCAVLSDMAYNRSYFSIGNFGTFLALDEQTISQEIIDSLNEDCIYNRIHPDELYVKRTFEIEYFLFLLNLPPHERTNYKASCKILMLNNIGEYVYIANQTQILQCDPQGNIWLVLCQYDIAPNQTPVVNIENKITNSTTGEIISLPLLTGNVKKQLTEREKQILSLIKEGYQSKEIADHLSISINTVNRHRQNILEKIGVSNSLEAVNKAQKSGIF